MSSTKRDLVSARRIKLVCLQNRERHAVFPLNNPKLKLL